jgi:hypothetical protein
MLTHFSKLKMLVLALCVLNLFWFQNCGQVDVSAIQPSTAPVTVLKDQPVYELCPVAGATISVPVTYVFVVDMSLSNLGGFINDNCASGSRYLLALENATDHELVNNRSVAKRLKGISDFVNQIADSNPNLRYSIIGFGTQKILGGSNVTCENSATSSKNEFLNRVSFLQNVQHSDYSKNGICSFNTPFTMGTTSYMSAIDCFSENIDAEITLSGANRPFYQVFFITDGKPNEKTTGGTLDLNAICGPVTTPANPAVTACRNTITACESAGTQNQIDTCIYDYITQNRYVPKVQTLVNNLQSRGFGFNLKPIFYERAGTLPDQSDFPQASSSLNRLAQADGSQTTTSPLTNLNSLVTELRDALGPQATVNYSFTSPIVVNANAKPSLDALALDTDEDGVPDSVEESLSAKGFDKNNPRSNGILDGICYYFFNGDNCAPSDLNTCQQTNLGYKINKCDQDKLKQLLPAKTLTGFDSDSDGIIDYLEILRGTNPLFSDYNLDDDEDGLMNTTEIFRGSDHQSNKPMHRENSTLVSIEEILSPANTQCVFPGTSLKIKMDNVALLQAKPTNTIIVSLIAEPIGSTNSKRRLYIGKYNLDSQGKASKLTLGNQDLELIGEF